MTTALTCKIGPSLTWDAVAYVRGQIEDTNGPNFLIPDTTLALYVEAAAEEFSKLEPLGEHVVGNIGGSPQTSPLSTLAGVSRYSCSVANGFLYPVAQVTDVMFKSSGIFSAASEMSYLQFMPASPFSLLSTNGSSILKPTDRVIREEMFDELDHYTKGFWGIGRGADGIKVIDIYPVPTSSGLPIFVRYTSTYLSVVDGNGNPTYPTVPEDLKRYFGKLLLVEVLEQEMDRIAKSSILKAGVMQRWSTPAAIRAYAENLKADIQNELGGSVTVVTVSH
jgi:hypothetical protein